MTRFWWLLLLFVLFTGCHRLDYAIFPDNHTHIFYDGASVCVGKIETQGYFTCFWPPSAQKVYCGYLTLTEKK